MTAQTGLSGAKSEERTHTADIDSTATARRFLFVGSVVRGEGHSWVGDEPVEAGGDGHGPSPFCQISGALAHCTISTMAARARMEGIPLEDAEVEVCGLVGTDAKGIFSDPKKLPPLDDEENIDCRIKKMTRKIRVTGDLTADQIGRLKQIADSCPVSETLRPAVRIRTTIEHLESVH